MRRWIIPAVVVVGLVALAASAKWWLPPLLVFVGANTDLIQGLTDLVQLVLWAGAGVVFVVGIWRRTNKTGSEGGPRYEATRGGSVSVAQDRSVIVGEEGLAVVGSTVGGT